MEAFQWSLGPSFSASELLDLLEDLDTLFPDSIPATPPPDLSNAFSEASTADSEEWIEPTGLSVKLSRNLGTLKKKSTFQRQKDELLSLRSQIEELETQLQNLRGDRQPVDITTFDPSIQQTALSLWRMVAKRQWGKRRTIEKENAELRKTVKEQTQLAKSLQRMIKTRPVRLCFVYLFSIIIAWGSWVSQAVIVVASNPQIVMKMLQQRSHQRQVAGVSERDADIFQELFDKIEGRMGSVDAYFAAHGLTPSTAGVNVTRAIPNNNSDSSHIEFTRATLMAFDFRSLSDVVWKLLRQSEMKMEGSTLHTHVVTDSDELIVTKQVLQPISTTGATGATAVFSVSRRVIQKERVLLFWEWLVEMNGSSACKIPASYLNQRGCGQIVRVDDRALNGLPALLLQLHGQLVLIQMEPSNHPSDLDQQQQYLDSAALSDMLLALHRQNTQTFLGSVEQALVEETLA